MGMKSYSQGQYIKVTSTRNNPINMDQQFFNPVPKKNEIGHNIKPSKMNFVAISSTRQNNEKMVTNKLNASNTNIKSLSAKDPENNRKSLDFRAPFFNKLVQDKEDKRMDNVVLKDSMILTNKSSMDKKGRQNDPNQDPKKYSFNLFEQNNNQRSSRHQKRANITNSGSAHSQ